jgi:hypothetical protein
MSRREALSIGLADANARIELAYSLLANDAAQLARLDWPAFRSRVDALLLDLETSTELLTALVHVSPGEEATLQARAHRIGEQRVQLHRWLKQIGSK